MNKYKKIYIKVITVLAIIILQMSVQAATNDYTQWKQGDSAWNQQEAWPASQYPAATARWMRQAGCVVTSVAMLLRHYNVVTTSDVNQFNPWICNEKLKSAGAFNNAADLIWGKVGSAYPGFSYINTVGYSFSTLQNLFNQGYACIIHASSTHYVALKGISGSDVQIMDPGYNRTSLSAYSSPSEIIYYKPTGSIDSTKPTIEDVYIKDIGKNGYYVHCIVRDNSALGRVEFPTWTALNEQDDIIWGSAGAVSGTSWELNYRVNYSDHKNETSGTYYTDIYCYDAAGNLATYKTVVHYPYNGSEMATGYDRVLPDGDYLIATTGTTDKSTFYYLDIDGGANPTNNTNVHLWGPTVDLSEYDVWTITYNDGFYTINQKGNNMFLDVNNADGNAVASGRNVEVYEEAGVSNQKWAISQSGGEGYRIQSKCSGCSLDVAGGKITYGTNVQQYANNNEAAQRWLFIPYKPSQPIEEEKYVLLSGLGDKWELDIPGDTGNVDDGVNVEIWSDTAASRYNSFRLVKLSNGYYKFIHDASGKCLDVANGSVTSSGNVSLCKDNGSIAQQWAIRENGSGYSIIARCSGYALDVWGNAADGVNVAQGYFHGGNNQTWKFVKADYSVQYDANGGSNAPIAQTKYYKTDLALRTAEPVREDYIFQGWAVDNANAESADYLPGELFKLDKDITLYAVWEAECDHQITYTVTTEPTLTSAGKLSGTCSICGKNKEIVLPALNDVDYRYAVKKASTCQKTGTATYTWEEPNGQSFTFEGQIEKIDHDYVSTQNPPTCIDNGSTTYTCTMCGDTYTERVPITEPSDEEGWTTEKPSGVSEDMIHTKTQYRYSDYQTKDSYDTSMTGWNQKSSRWEKNGGGTIQYVQSWPAGFSTSHNLYGTYNKSAISASETATAKTTINSNSVTGYLYYHWCRNNYTAGPINRATSKTWTSEFNTFHAFYSTTNPGGLTASPDGDGSRTYANGSVCKDSHWYYNVPVYSQSYTTYRKLFTYERWTDWSGWSDTQVTASSTKKVETRTLYKYDVDRDNRHVWGDPEYTWDETTNALTAEYHCTMDASHEKTEVIENVSVMKLPIGTKEIEEEAFSGIASQVVIIPDGCTKIGSKAFADCPNLLYIEIPDSVSDIAEDAFSGSVKLTGNQ